MDLEGNIGSINTTEADKVDEKPRTRTQTIVLMLALCLAVFLAALDAVIITTALPTITHDIGASDAGFAWIGAAYLLASATSVPFWGKTSDVFGRKPVLIVAQAIFMAGSLVSALATALGVLIAGRAVQGLGAGGVMALVNITVGDLFSPRERGLYFSMIGAVWGLASGVGPLVGGGLTEGLSWRWCFWINLPVSAISLVMLIFFLRIHNPRASVVRGLAAIDWLGTFTFTTATIMFLLGLELGGIDHPWDSPEVLCLLIFGLAMYALFALTQLRLARYPLMPPRLFANPSVLAVYGATFAHGLAFAGLAFFLPLYFQGVLGASPVDSGVWLLAVAVPLAICTVGVGVAIRATGRYVEIVRTAMGLMVLGMGLFTTFPARRDWVRILMFQAVAAVGVAPNLQALLIALQALVAREDLATGTATFAFVRNVAVGVGVVIGQVIFRGAMGEKIGVLVEAGVNRGLAEELAGGSTIASIGRDVALGLGERQGKVFREVMAQSLSRLWVFYSVAAGLGLVLTFFIRQVELSSTHVAMEAGVEAEEARGRGTDAQG
ncbi:hypothetical protein ACHAQH_004702 [Verticillium albo-atrum]